jgi:hypothetical protein
VQGTLSREAEFTGSRQEAHTMPYDIIYQHTAVSAKQSQIRLKLYSSLNTTTAPQSECPGSEISIFLIFKV